MQIFTLNITRVVWPHVPSLLDLRYFCRHNPLSYDLKLVPGHYWSWQRTISFLVNIFVRHTFSMSKSSIKTETALTMTDTTEPTELLAFKRQKDGYKVTEKFPFVFLLFYHISHFLIFSVKFVYSNGRLQSRIFLSPHSWWFCLGQHKSVERSLTSRVSAYWSRNTVYSSLHRSAHIWFSYIHNHYSILIVLPILIA